MFDDGSAALFFPAPDFFDELFPAQVIPFLVLF